MSWQIFISSKSHILNLLSFDLCFLVEKFGFGVRWPMGVRVALGAPNWHTIWRSTRTERNLLVSAHLQRRAFRNFLLPAWVTYKWMGLFAPRTMTWFSFSDTPQHKNCVTLDGWVFFSLAGIKLRLLNCSSHRAAFCLLAYVIIRLTREQKVKSPVRLYKTGEIGCLAAPTTFFF